MSTTESGWTLTAYCPCKKCCGPNAKGITACGLHVNSSHQYKICAAPKNFPCGKTIHISGGWNGSVVVQDRGGAIKGKRLDIFCADHNTALRFGKKTGCTISY